MSPRLVALLLLLACISLTNAVPMPCPADEVYKSCGTACPRRCGVPPAPQCISVCVTGCFCKEGYQRNKDNKCVLPENC